jgi:hypothetical protein
MKLVFYQYHVLQIISMPRWLNILYGIYLRVGRGREGRERAVSPNLIDRESNSGLEVYCFQGYFDSLSGLLEDYILIRNRYISRTSPRVNSNGGFILNINTSKLYL